MSMCLVSSLNVRTKASAPRQQVQWSAEAPSHLSNQKMIVSVTLQDCKGPECSIAPAVKTNDENGLKPSCTASVKKAMGPMLDAPRAKATPVTPNAKAVWRHSGALTQSSIGS